MEYILGLVLSVFGAIISNAIGSSQAATARRETFEYNEKSADKADQRTRALYNDIGSPEQQITSTISGLKSNGLSPSVFYSGGSVNGATQNGAQGGGAGNIMPNVFGVNPLEGAQIRLTEAQAENLEADTAKKQEETKTEKGENQKGAAEIAKAWNEAGLSEAAKKLTEAQTVTQDLINYVSDKTKDVNITTAAYMLDKANAERNYATYLARESKVKAEIAEETKEAYIEQINYENAKILSEVIANKAKTKLTNKEVDKLRSDIEMLYKNYDIAMMNAETAARQAGSAEKANKIKDAARRDAINMFNAEMRLKYAEYQLENDRMLYEFGEKTITTKHYGNQYSPITYDENKVTYKK